MLRLLALAALLSARGRVGASDHPELRAGESWFWDFRSNDYVDGRELAPPVCHPEDQPVPGPAGRVPADWQSRLN